jgi:uncharacterized protein YuzE
MQLEYDLNVGALYIKLSDEEIVRTREAGDNAAVDLDEVGNVVGIEVISVVHPWPLADILRDHQIPAVEVAEITSYFRLDDTCLLQPDIPELNIASRPPTLVAA